MSTLKELDQEVIRRIDRSFLVQGVPVDADDLVEDLPRDVDLSAAEAVIAEAMRRFPREERQRSDAWVGPRLHAGMRLTRREAARRGIWRYLGVVVFPEYVRWRWSGEKDGEIQPPTLDRFVGPDYKQALARLWWMAELFRNADDYGPAAAALSNQDVTNNLFRMDVAHHRPTAVGSVAVLGGSSDDETASGREANALAKAVNAAATTLAIDLIAPDDPLDDAARERWIDEASGFDAAEHFDQLPSGPEDPEIPPASLSAMSGLLRNLLRSAPVRGRG